ncbi:MAG: hypothetical protein KJN97_18270, partial [Deltaproteobacteria bacterium]|nr:hypothetical protein [Deltaproteobacteria bacterium]
CDDQSSCTSDLCNPLIGCTYANLCDIRARCIAGACECMAGYVGDGYECGQGPPHCGDGACGDTETHVTCAADCNCDLVVIVEEALTKVLANRLFTYLDDLEAEGLRGSVQPWTPGTVEELKSFIFAQVDKCGAQGVFLIGNMPAAWYEQTAFDTDEEFPIDLYLQDRDAVWGDADGDGIYDTHSDLELDVYLSRLQTLPDPEECVSSSSFPTCPASYDPGAALYASEACIEHCPSGFVAQSWTPAVECCGTFFLKRYFDRLHEYRTSGSLVNESAFVFTDDSWWTWGRPFGLDSIYSTVDIVTELSETTREKYVEMLIGGGAEFVYHWIHATPDNLLIYVDDTCYPIHRTQIGWSPHLSPSLTYNFEASFVNMFSCEAARFTVPNIGMAMAFQTDFGLAILGSTKKGGIWNPDLLHANLARGLPWGEAYRLWYNNTGYTDDEWHLGMALLGDPSLTLTGDRTGLMKLDPERAHSPEYIEALRQSIIDRPQLEELDTFEEYREANPQFFD